MYERVCVSLIIMRHNDCAEGLKTRKFRCQVSCAAAACKYVSCSHMWSEPVKSSVYLERGWHVATKNK